MFIQTIFLVLLIFLKNSYASQKIIFLFPLAAASECGSVFPLVQEMVKRGYEVTFVSSMESKWGHENYTEMTPIASPTTEDYVPGESNNILDYRLRYKRFLPFVFGWNWKRLGERCEGVYEDESFKKKILNGTFDLIVVNGLLHHCLMGLVYKLRAPFVVMHSVPYTGDVFQSWSVRMPPSFVPSSITSFSDRMTFHERLLNTVFRWVHALSYDFIVGKEAEQIYRKYLGQDLPSLGEIEARASLILSNSHPALTHPRPLTPDLIEVGCIHCREAKKLDNKFANFLDSSVRGVIYFSLGSMFKLTPEMFQSLLKAFRRLRQDLIINTDFDVPPCNLSRNVMLTKWAPQQDILGHSKLKLFITHGGIQSFFEGVFHAVPLIVLPIWADQALVGGSVEKKLGNGLVLEILDLTEDKIVSAVETVLKDNRFAKKALELSLVFKDQLETPLTRAAYWLEYVLRQNGARYLHSAARDLNTFQYYGIDIILFLLLLIIILLGLCRYRNILLRTDVKKIKVE